MTRSGETFSNAVVDPPATAHGGGAERAPAAGFGGGTGANYLATAWDVICGQPQCCNDLSDFLAEVQDSPQLRAGATLRALTRMRTELERIPESSGLSDPVVITLQDASLLVTQLLSRLR